MKSKRLFELSFLTTYYFTASVLVIGSLFFLLLSIAFAGDGLGFEFLFYAVALFAVFSYMVARKSSKGALIATLLKATMPFLCAYGLYLAISNYSNWQLFGFLPLALLIAVGVHIYLEKIKSLPESLNVLPNVKFKKPNLMKTILIIVAAVAYYFIITDAMTASIWWTYNLKDYIAFIVGFISISTYLFSDESRLKYLLTTILFFTLLYSSYQLYHIYNYTIHFYGSVFMPTEQGGEVVGIYLSYGILAILITGIMLAPISETKFLNTY